MKHNIIAVLIGLALAALILGGGEFAARRTGVHVQGTDAKIFANPYDDLAYFQAANVAGRRAFGAPVYTDAEGMRVPSADYRYPAGPALLLLGDSVAFGIGVKEEQSFAGLLRARHAGPVYNASAIGFNAANHLQAARHFIKKHPARDVVLMLALNDAEEISSRDIRAYGKKSAAPEPLYYTTLDWVNALLRSRSSLFVWLKNQGRDASADYFKADVAPWQDAKTRETAIGFVEDAAKLARANGARFHLYLMPYEYQLRTDGTLEPQHTIGQALLARGLAFTDLAGCLRQGGSASRELYLFADPMHLSPLGHEKVAACLAKDLAE